MIVYTQSLPIGDAVRVIVRPPEGADAVRVLRKAGPVFAGADDPDAARVYEGGPFIEGFVDHRGLVNGSAVRYQAFARVAGVWAASGGAATATPAAAASLDGADPVALLRDRLEAGLQVEVAAGRLRHRDGYIPCLTAPPPMDPEPAFPLVTVQLVSDTPFARGIGEDLADDEAGTGPDGAWDVSDGWLSRVSVDVWGHVVNNPDARGALRRAIGKVLIGNLALFASEGLDQFDFTLSDHEELEQYNAPIYQTRAACAFNTPWRVRSIEPAVAGVSVAAETPESTHA